MRSRSFTFIALNVMVAEMTETDKTVTDDSTQIGLKFGWLIFLALGVQVVALGYVNEFSFNAARILLVASYVVLFPVVWMNIRKPGIALVMIGLALNFVVIAANGGSMPIDPIGLGVSTENADAFTAHDGFIALSKDSVFSDGEAKLRVLSDIFPLPGPLKIAFSIGDVFIVAGVILFAFAPLLPKRLMRR